MYRGKGQALPPFFANLIPEGSLRELIQQSLKLPEDDLSLLGESPSALQLAGVAVVLAGIGAATVTVRVRRAKMARV